MTEEIGHTKVDLVDKLYIGEKSKHPPVLSKTETKVSFAGFNFRIKTLVLNPFTDFSVPYWDFETPIEPIDASHKKTILAQREKPQNFLAIVGEYMQKGCDTDMTVYSSAVPNHQQLGGCMYEAGVPWEKIVRAHNTGLEIPFLPQFRLPPALTRYKYAFCPGNNKDGGYIQYHVYTRRPDSAPAEAALELAQNLARMAGALDWALDPLARHTLGCRPINGKVVTLSGEIFSGPDRRNKINRISESVFS